MAKIFCVANQKGGVGKTTTSVNLSAGLAKLDQRVLLVDLDPQGNATMGAGINKAGLKASTYEVMLGESDVRTARQRSEAGRFDVLPSNRELAGAEVEMVELDRRESRLKDALAEVDGDYDFILVDCPPALSMLTLNGLCAAHGVIIPMQCEYYALEGLSDLVNTIKKVHANLNPELKIIGLLARDVRSAHDIIATSVGPAGTALWRQGLQDHHPAQRAPGRSAIVWIAWRQLRPQLERRASVYRLWRRDGRTHQTYVRSKRSRS